MKTLKNTHTHTILFAGRVKCTTHVLSFARLWYTCSLNALLPRAQHLCCTLSNYTTHSLTIDYHYQSS